MVQGPGYGLTFLYYFAITAVIAILLGHQGTGVSWQDPALYKISVPFALLVASIGAYINQNTLLSIPLPKQSARVTKVQALKTLLDRMGYAELEDDEGIQIYRRTGLAKYLSGDLFVQVENKEILISGRSSMLNQIEKQLGDS